jgi:general secretion pathway protein K
MTPGSIVRDQRGFALLATSLVLAVLGVVVTEFAFATRLETSMVRAYKEGILARNLAEAGIQQAMREILSESTIQGLDEDGQVAFFRAAQVGAAPQRLPTLVRSRVALGQGDFSYRITDEEGRLNVNSGGDRVARLLQALGVDRSARDAIAASIEDWRDGNELSRANGAESDDTYLRLPVPYRARDGNFQDTAELLQVKGVTPELYHGNGTPEQPGLADLLTARGRGVINLNTAPRPVLEAAGLSDAEINDVIQARASSPYTSVPGRFGGRRLAVGSTTFRIEAEGWIGGQPKVRIVTIVQRSGRPGSASGSSVQVFTWRLLPPRGIGQSGAAPG